MDKLKVILLGTNGWFCTETGETISILINSTDYAIVLDAGNGIRKLDRYIDNTKPVYLFLSHFHMDHINGLHILPKFKFEKELTIIGQKGTQDLLKTIQNAPFTKPALDLPFEVNVVEVPEKIKSLPFKIKVLPMVHSAYTQGIRIEIEDKVISYCPDTGYCKNAVELSKNADLVITECAYKSNQTNDEWPHLNPESAAQIAKNSDAKKLVLVHFDARNYTSIEDRKTAEQAACKIFPNTFAGFDDMEIDM